MCVGCIEDSSEIYCEMSAAHFDLVIGSDTVNRLFLAAGKAVDVPGRGKWGEAVHSSIWGIYENGKMGNVDDGRPWGFGIEGYTAEGLAFVRLWNYADVVERHLSGLVFCRVRWPDLPPGVGHPTDQAREFMARLDLL